MSDIDFQNGLIVGLTLAGRTSIVGGGLHPWKQMLYDEGDECTVITGGWVAGYIYGSGEHSKQVNHLYSKTTTSNSWRFWVTTKKIDITNISKLYFEIEITTLGYSYCFTVTTSSTGFGGTSVATKQIMLSSSSKMVFELDVSSVTGLYYIGFSPRDNITTTKTYRIWGE